MAGDGTVKKIKNDFESKLTETTVSGNSGEGGGTNRTFGEAATGTGDGKANTGNLHNAQNPQQDQRTKPQFYTNHEGIRITWDNTLNGANYKLQITRKQNDEYKEFNTAASQYFLKQNVFGWNIGEVIHVSIYAEVGHDKNVTICHNEEYVVGGKRVPSMVELAYEQKNPYNSMTLTWQKPKANPDKFRVTVYEVGGKDNKEIKYSLETLEVTETLTDLDPLTKYQCAVVAIYLQGADSTAVMSNILQTQDLPPEKLKVEDVQIYKDTQNPSRQIIVKFKSTSIIASLIKKFEKPHFEVYLTDENNLKTEVQKIDGTMDGKYECCFKYLKSNTTYEASITTIRKKDKKKSKEAKSKKITTSIAQRTPNFNIQVAGKPLIQTCESKKNKLASKIEWDLPELGIDQFNYKFVGVEASIMLEEGEFAEGKVLEVTENRKSKPTPLLPGKTYLVRVQSVYLDIDASETVKATAARQLNTDIDSPKIEDITWSERIITVVWIKAKGAEKHILKISNKESNQVVFDSGKLSSTTKKIKMGKQYSFGDTCTFTVEATATNTKQTSTSKTLLIGGDSVVTNVVAKTERRQIDVSWKHPKQNPIGYNLVLFELYGQTQTEASVHEEVHPLERTLTSHNFTDLKSSTNYCCQISPIYQTGTDYATQSNTVKTVARITNAHEKEKSFGKTTVFHDTTELENGTVNVTLSWKKVSVGPNFKLTEYHAALTQRGKWLYDTTLFNKILGADDKHIPIKNIAKGYKYEFKLRAVYKDLDSGENNEKETEHSFATTPSQTNVNDCTLKDGVISFTWNPVGGATKYHLIIKDELQVEDLAEHIIVVETEGGGCQANIQTNEKLGVGRTCVTKVTAYVDNAMSSTSDWKVHLIGGTKVARNVQASRNSENPFRTVNISFDSPKEGNASVYKIIAVPSSGRRKTIYTRSSPTLFEYLRKGVSYSFEVWVKLHGTWFGPSLSNSIFTDGDKPKKMLEVTAKNHATVDLKGAQFREESKDITFLQGDEFGCIRDLDYAYKVSSDEDLVTLNWTEPTFGNKRADYKVEKFKIEIRKAKAHDGDDDYVEFDKSIQQYSTKTYKFELGGSFNVSVFTIYEDIDKDVMYVSSAVKLLIHTRPCQPRIHRNIHENEKLKIQWSKVKGAQVYEVDIFTENSKDPFTTEVKENSYTKPFDETFGFGTSYYAVVRACGEDSKYNESKTERKVIGGNYVATDVSATTEHEKVTDPNFQVFLQWTAPQIKPKGYIVEVFPDTKGQEIDKIMQETCLISKLKAGTEYYFKVKAEHTDGKLSGGCCSNKVQTNPTPTQVKRVECEAGENKSTSHKVYWDKVDAERENETTEYRICLIEYDKNTNAISERKVTVQEQHITLNGLQPGAVHSVTVAGGNSLGFGRESEKVTFKTEWGTPKNVILSNNQVNPTTSVKLAFEKAEGYVQCYKAALYKCQNKTEHQITKAEEIQTLHTFEDLEPDTEYIAKVHAIAAKEEIGKWITSNRVVTAPSKTKIEEKGCCKDEKYWSSREIYATWKSDPGCDYHEITIKCGTFTEPECKMFAQNTKEIKYFCRNESAQYSIQVRSRNSSGYFGEPSDQAIVYLAPAKLEDVVAELIEGQEAIRIRCRKALYHSPFYFMKASRDGQIIPEKTEKKECNDASTTSIEWIFTPKESAEIYNFELWGEDAKGIKGKRTVVKATSRPSKGHVLAVDTLEHAPNTDVKITWEEVNGCNNYDVAIKVEGQESNENLGQFTGGSCTYRCQSPGNKYLIFVRAICGTVKGSWSEPFLVTLAPADVMIIEDSTISNKPVESVPLKWKALAVDPDGYLVTLFSDNIEVEKVIVNTTEHEFKDSLKPGSLCHCTVVAYSGEKFGKATKSKNYRIKWGKPDFFYVKPDDNEPTAKAKMKWAQTPGVTHFRLEIENDQTGVVIHREVNGLNYIFENGIPGNTYSVRLFCGCDGRFNTSFSEDKIVLKPNPPTEVKVIANKKINGLSIEFKDTVSARKSYKVSIKPLITSDSPEPKITKQHSLIWKDLIPGEGYKVSVKTVIGKAESEILSTEDHIHTFPAEVKNLDSEFMDGAIKFKWEPLDIKPDKYIIQWRVNNESITEEYTEGTSFSICCLKPATWYRLRVMACMKGNCGSVSEWKAYITRPSPPHSVQVKKDERSPQTCLVVRFEDEEDMQKSYKVTAWYNDKAAREVTTKNHFAFLKDLTPGNPYIITVETLFCGEKSDIATVMRI